MNVTLTVIATAIVTVKGTVKVIETVKMNLQ